MAEIRVRVIDVALPKRPVSRDRHLQPRLHPPANVNDCRLSFAMKKNDHSMQKITRNLNQWFQKGEKFRGKSYFQHITFMFISLFFHSFKGLISFKVLIES